MKNITASLEMRARIAGKYGLGIIEEHLQYYRHNHVNLSRNYQRLRADTEYCVRIMLENPDAGARPWQVPGRSSLVTPTGPGACG